GMRRYTTYCMDLALGEEGRLYVLCREDAQGGNIRRTNWEDEDLDVIGGSGTADGQFMWPVSIVRDAAENLYVSDEGLHRIQAFDRHGKFLGKWGKHGAGDGELNRPSGIAFDVDENFVVADTLNNRVQKFTRDGGYLTRFGSLGTGNGELNMPWGVAVDDQGLVYVSDWGNDRVQVFDAQSKFVMAFGRSGSGDGELNGPAGIAVDAHGDIYVADRGNNRVLQFDRNGRYVEKFIGDATISRAGRRYILANPKVLRAREMTTLEQQKRLRGPCGVRIDDQLRLYIADFGSHRIQVYKKEAYPLTPEEIFPQPSAPSLYAL
ncbi:MAG: NHL repeat-containing protein, partial [Chloroflexi bacterium]|nr:NHL repeat-containing protein [Chloroflexota bacterium]